MKLLTPSIKDCRYIHRKLRKAYDDNIDNHVRPNRIELDRAIKRFCEFYNINNPTIEFYKKLQNALGTCHRNGTISLITPYWWINGGYWGGRENWIEVIYHELGHYVLWADEERKAEAFAKRMMDKWRK